MIQKLFVASLLVLFFFSGIAHAQTEELPDPGITPDSPFYVFDTLGEDISLFFAFGDEAKTKKAVAIANEKVAEVQVMAEKDNEEGALKAAERYGEVISTAAEKLSTAAQSGEGFDTALAELIAKATAIHVSVLTDVYEKVPDQAKPAIERAMQQSARGQEEAVQAVSGEKKEEVRQEVENQRQEVQQKLDTLREEGKPVPSIQLNQGTQERIPVQGGQSISPPTDTANSENRGAGDTGKPQQLPGRP